jgi:hypothetical protein
MAEILKPGFRWIFTAKTEAHAQTALSLLRTVTGVLQVRVKGPEIRWSTPCDLPRLVEALSRLPGELQRRRLSENCHPKTLLHAPNDAELARLREAASSDSALTDGDTDPVLAVLLERGWMVRVTGTPPAYALTDLGRGWAE